MTNVPRELKEKLLDIAMSTDCVGLYNLQGWRLNAVCAARWLLRAAAIGTPSNRSIVQVFSNLARAAEIMNDEDYTDKINEFLS